MLSPSIVKRASRSAESLALHWKKDKDAGCCEGARAFQASEMMVGAPYFEQELRRPGELTRTSEVRSLKSADVQLQTAAFLHSAASYGA